MENKLKKLLGLVPIFDMWETPEGYWIQYQDAYEKRTLCDSDLNSLLDRAICIAEVSERSAAREQTQNESSH